MLIETLTFVNLLSAGLLAGEEFVIRFGVRAPLASLAPLASIQFRQALIRRLRVVVPILFGVTVLSAATVTLLAGPGFGFRCAALVALFAFITVTLAGTVPINKAVLAWEASAPPVGWAAIVRRWEQLDTVRTFAALASFGLLLAAGFQR